MITTGAYRFTGDYSQRTYYRFRVEGESTKSYQIGAMYQLVGPAWNVHAYFNIYAGLLQDDEEIQLPGVHPIGGGTLLRGWSLPFVGSSPVAPGDYTLEVYGHWRGGYVPGDDLGYRVAFFGIAAPPAAQSVPEPSSLALVVGALFGALPLVPGHRSRNGAALVQHAQH